MVALIDFVFFVVGGLLSLMILVLIVTAILSWLVMFDVINLRNNGVSRIYYALQSFVEPLLAPIRRIMPPLGGVDLSFIVLFLILQGTQIFLLPAAKGALLSLFY
jgi:YggT family protein